MKDLFYLRPKLKVEHNPPIDWFLGGGIGAAPILLAERYFAFSIM